jgi:ubiquinone/menaquinone biosynthesis C-methylase UbiE
MKNLIYNIDFSKKIILELGCGTRKRIIGSIGIDAIEYDEVDIVGDVLDVLSHFPANSVDMVHSHHFIAHLDDLKPLMLELERVLKIGGKMEMIAPHFSNPYYYSDPTHKIFLGLYTFCYFTECKLFTKTVPVYGHDLKFKLTNVDLIFKSPRPFYFRYAFKRVFGYLFNLNSYLKEFYEENLVYLISCYEVKYYFERINSEQ